MSHIIDISASSSLYFSQIASSRSTLSFQHLLQYLKTFTNLTQHFKSFHTKGEKCQIILEINFQKHLPSVVQRIVIDKRRMTYQSKFILSKGSQIVACETKCLRLMIIKELQQLKKKMRIYSFSFSIDQSSGEIIGKNILTLTQQTNIYQLLLFQITALQNNLSRFLTISLTNINFLPALFTEFMHEKYKNINEVNVEDRIQKRIYKYFHFSIIELWRSYSKAPSESLEEPDDKLLQEQLENEVPTGFNQQSSEIYIYRSISKFMTPHKFQISSEQNSNIQIHLKIPMIQAKRSQSNFVFSQIKVLDESSDTIDTGLRGASNKILLSKLKFAYINSISSSNQNNNRAPPVKQYTKLVAIKTPLQKHTERQRKRNQHEIKILRIFSEAESPFLLRYFYTLSPNFKCSNMLMMSFVSNCETYGSFISKKRNILSFSSKVYLLINVLQALRLIKDYNVVHMDISPSNILVNSNYITQLIDFGQSYHQKLCGKDYNPGYTLPFSFPEKFSAKEFTNKSDMFSFGVLTFYSIFRSLPYNPTQKLVDSLKKFTYSNKFYFAPESVQYYGYKKLIIFLFTYIQRCLNPDPILRPHPAWSIILFKQLYFWLQQVSMMS